MLSEWTLVHSQLHSSQVDLLAIERMSSFPGIQRYPRVSGLTFMAMLHGPHGSRVSPAHCVLCTSAFIGSSSVIHECQYCLGALMRSAQVPAGRPSYVTPPPHTASVSWLGGCNEPRPEVAVRCTDPASLLTKPAIGQ